MFVKSLRFVKAYPFADDPDEFFVLQNPITYHVIVGVLVSLIVVLIFGLQSIDGL